MFICNCIKKGEGNLQPSSSYLQPTDFFFQETLTLQKKKKQRQQEWVAEDLSQCNPRGPWGQVQDTGLHLQGTGLHLLGTVIQDQGIHNKMGTVVVTRQLMASPHTSILLLMPMEDGQNRGAPPHPPLQGKGKNTDIMATRMLMAVSTGLLLKLITVSCSPFRSSCISVCHHRLKKSQLSLHTLYLNTFFSCRPNLS
jgi:hypothetical protein